MKDTEDRSIERGMTDMPSERYFQWCIDGYEAFRGSERYVYENEPSRRVESTAPVGSARPIEAVRIQRAHDRGADAHPKPGMKARRRPNGRRKHMLSALLVGAFFIGVAMGSTSLVRVWISEPRPGVNDIVPTATILEICTREPVPSGASVPPEGVLQEGPVAIVAETMLPQTNPSVPALWELVIPTCEVPIDALIGLTLPKLPEEEERLTVPIVGVITLIEGKVVQEPELRAVLPSASVPEGIGSVAATELPARTPGVSVQETWEPEANETEAISSDLSQSAGVMENKDCTDCSTVG